MQTARSSCPCTSTARVGLDEQFGYYPEYDRNVPTFDSRNVPYIRSRTSDQDDTSHVDTMGTEGWVELDLLAALAARYPDMVRTHGAAGTRATA